MAMFRISEVAGLLGVSAGSAEGTNVLTRVGFEAP
jgi:hypothetical protein